MGLIDENAERGLLGCCILGAFDEAVADGVNEEWFGSDCHRSAWHLIEGVAMKGTVSEQRVIMAAACETDWRDKKTTLLEFVDNAPTRENYHYWREPCRLKVLQRSYHRFAVNLQQSVIDAADVDAVADSAESGLFELRKFAESERGNNRRESFSRIIEMMKRAHKGDGIVGLSSGFADLDGVLGGLRDGSLYTIAARPGMGKSTLAMNIAEHLTMKGGASVAFFSLEMSEDELNQRMLASHCGFNLQSFINHGYAKSDRGRILEQMTGSIPELEAGPLHICPRTDITIGQLRAETRRLVSKRGVKLVIVDYMQLVGVAARRGASRVDEVGEISRGLKKMALELDLPVIALAQLNRSIENDNNRSPRLSDLRESGSIEADSDVVIFIHREKKGVFIDSRMLCQIVIGKNRNGPQGVFDLCFDREVCRFEDWRKHQDLVAEAEKLRS